MPQTCGPLGAHGHGLLPASSILTAHGMALEEHGSLEAQLDARDVNGVLRNRQIFDKRLYVRLHGYYSYYT